MQLDVKVALLTTDADGSHGMPDLHERHGNLH